jgi:hypothetical protein
MVLAALDPSSLAYAPAAVDVDYTLLHFETHYLILHRH